MTEGTEYRTRSGKVLSDSDIEAMADEAERGYDVEALCGRPRGRGRPMIGEGMSKIVPVRLDPALRRAVEAHAEAEEASMSGELLRAPEAARRLGLPTKEMLRLMYERQIRYVMVKGIAHVPDDAVEEFRGRAS